jgi:hypothetical protein
VSAREKREQAKALKTGAVFSGHIPRGWDQVGVGDDRGAHVILRVLFQEEKRGHTPLTTKELQKLCKRADLTGDWYPV